MKTIMTTLCTQVPRAMSPVESAAQALCSTEYERNTWRCIHVSNIPDTANVSQLLALVSIGPIEYVRFLSHKHCALLLFVNHATALHFIAEAVLNKKTINGQKLAFCWAKSIPISETIADAVNNKSACRNLYIGSLPEGVKTDEVHDVVKKFGPVEKIKISPNNVCFVHFLSITSAMRALQSGDLQNKWPGCKPAYGKDNGNQRPRRIEEQIARSAAFLGPQYKEWSSKGLDNASMTYLLAQIDLAAITVGHITGGTENVGNRTIYLGKLHPAVTTTEICNATRGGALQSLRYLPEKHMCFITFIEAVSAAQFYTMWTTNPLYIHSRYVHVNWGKPADPLPQHLVEAVAAGASRNVYLSGAIENLTEEELRADCSTFGEVEQVNFLPERSCTFVNFTELECAVVAVAHLAKWKKYKNYVTRFGKDRCGRQPLLPTTRNTFDTAG